jgi:hypothetical protein
VIPRCQELQEERPQFFGLHISPPRVDPTMKRSSRFLVAGSAPADEP